MKRAVWFVLQTMLFLVVFLAGSLLPGAHLLPLLSVSAGPGRIFVLDGLLLMLCVYLILLGIQVARRRVRSSWPVPTLALLLSLLAGLAMKFGFMSV